MPTPNHLKYKHVDWHAIRQLVAQGLTLKQISEATGIKRNTLMARSSRERWNCMAIRTGLRPATTPTRDSGPDAQLIAIKNGVTLPLVKLARFYQNADLDLLRKDSARFMSFVNASLKLLSLNDAKSSDKARMTVNLQVLASVPASPVDASTRQVEAVQLPEPIGESDTPKE